MKLYKFYADWCCQCKALSKKLPNEIGGIEIINCDVDAESDFADVYNIKTLPTIVLTDIEGKELGRWFSNVTISDIEEKIKEYGTREQIV